MNDILLFIMEYCSDLYYLFGFRFVDSSYYEGDNSMVVLAKGNLQFVFTRDRGQMFLDIEGRIKMKRIFSFSIDLIRRLIDGSREFNAILDKENGDFVNRNIDRIIDLFSESKIETTKKELELIRRERMKIIFR